MLDQAREEKVDGGVEQKLVSLWKSCHASNEVAGNYFVGEFEDIGFGGHIYGV